MSWVGYGGFGGVVGFLCNGAFQPRTLNSRQTPTKPQSRLQPSACKRKSGDEHSLGPLSGTLPPADLRMIALLLVVAVAVLCFWFRLFVCCSGADVACA